MIETILIALNLAILYQLYVLTNRSKNIQFDIDEYMTDLSKGSHKLKLDLTSLKKDTTWLKGDIDTIKKNLCVLTRINKDDLKDKQ